jgi:hypothetical protein
MNDEYVEQLIGSNGLEWYRNNLKNWPFTSEKDYHWSNDHSQTSPAYWNSYAHICTETHVDKYEPTEKTIKALKAGNLTFFLTQKDYIDQLTRVGFDFDFQGIDYSYDKEPDWQQRTRSMLAEVNRIYQDISDIWHVNRDRLKHNAELFHSGEFKSTILQDVKDLIC